MDLQTSPSPLVRRAVGLGMAAASAWMTNLSWVQARRDGQFSMAAALMGPAFCVIGLGLVLFKGYRQERLERGEDISRLHGLALLTPRWKGVLAVAIGAMLINFLLLKGWL